MGTGFTHDVPVLLEIVRPCKDSNYDILVDVVSLLKAAMARARIWLDLYCNASFLTEANTERGEVTRNEAPGHSPASRGAYRLPLDNSSIIVASSALAPASSPARRRAAERKP
jgi:hypothetical protein